VIPPSGPHAPTPVVVGVDGGGTGSRAVVLDASGRVLGREVGSAAIVVPGAETASLEAIQDLVRRVLRAAGLPPGVPARVLVAGLAGVGRAADRERVEVMLGATLASLGLARQVVVRNDAEVALHDAFGDGPGILLVGGTGSIALARLPSGRTLRTGGWGALAGDEGSGWSLGLGAVRAVLRTMDGRGAPTGLTRIVVEAFGTDDPAELVDRLRTAAKGQVAALAPRVAEVADAGDAVAISLMDEAASALAAHVTPLTRAWRQESGAGGEPPRLALLGGLVAPGGPLRSRLLPHLEALDAVVSPGALDPARGAARLALSI
jgi:N-acetylglucosamine kinase-like BadF-type ATPase